MGADTKILLQAVQGIMGVISASQQSNAAQDVAEREAAELERQKDEEKINERSKRSDRAREADRQFATMLVSMADNGGAGTGNAARFAGEIGFVSGIDLARISGNSISKRAALSAKQDASRARADNISSAATGSAFAALLTAAGGITGTIATRRERERKEESQKQHSGPRTTSRRKVV